MASVFSLPITVSFSGLLTLSRLAAFDVTLTPATEGIMMVEGGGAIASSGMIEELSGPTDAASGFRSDGPVDVRLPSEIGACGSLMFWFRSDRAYRAGKSERRESIPLAQIGDVVRVSFEQEGNAIKLFVQWDESVDTAIDRHVRVLMPEFPGEEWHHFALHWNEKEGLINVFLDGTPFYWIDERVSAWSNARAATLTLNADRFALADVRVTDEPFQPGELAGIVGESHLGRLDTLLGASDLGTLDAGPLRGNVLYQSSMANADAMEDWRLEGPGRVEYADGWMIMESLSPDGPDGHIVNWCPVDFPTSFVAEWEFQLLSENGLCIAFFSAKGRNGEDLFDPALQPREGIFSRYVKGDIDSYHISYFADTPLNPRLTTNLRKNFGLNLVASGPAGVPANSSAIHKVTLVKEGARIRMAVDGRVIIDFTDDGETFGPVLREGKIGLRQMQWTKGRYRNFRVSELAITDSPQPSE